MLSKEEIENVEHAIKKFNGKLVDCLSIGKMLTEYYNLESKEQKLIEKLEEEMQKNEWALKGYDCTISNYKQSQAIGAYIALQKIREEILKGEKE